MRFRPLTHPARAAAVAERLRLRRAGLLAPLAVAVALAVVGHEVSTSTSSSAASVAARPVSAFAPDLPDLAGARRSASGPTVAPPRQSVARKQPAKKKRASRAKARKAAPSRSWVRPARGPLTSRYGMRWGRMHRGIDIGASYGSPIYAAASGVVTFAGAQSGYGRLVTIRHGGGWTTAYGHMSRTVVRSGQRVSAGQVIAYVGSEGRSTGPHLHFEVRSGGGAVNPIPFLRSRGVRL